MAHKPASRLEVGDRVAVGNTYATYIGRPELAGTVIPVVRIKLYQDGPVGSDSIGITLEGCPEVCAATWAQIEVAT